MIFNHVYNIVSIDKTDKGYGEKGLSHLLDTLKSMQSFNYKHRPYDRVLRNHGIVSDNGDLVSLYKYLAVDKKLLENAVR